MTVFVYKITNRMIGKCYFGITKATIHFRWRQHVLLAKRGNRKGALQGAIVKYGEDAFDIVEVYVAIDVREAQSVERGLIAQHGTMWPNGYNMSTGGELRTGYRVSSDTKKKMRETALGRIISDRQRVLASENMKRLWEDPVYRSRAELAQQSETARALREKYNKKMSEERKGKPGFFTGRTHSEESRRIISEKGKGRSTWNKGIPMSDEQKALLAAVNTGRKQTKEEIAKRMERCLTPEILAKRSAKMKAKWADPVWRESLLKCRAQVPKYKREWSPEQRIAASDHMRNIMSDPVRKARAVEAGKAQWLDPEKHATWASAARARGLVKTETKKYGPSTAAVRAMARQLPTVIYPREVAL